MRRLASLLAGGALFLIFGAIPALADGGPHQLAANSGSGGISSDSCAGCHRAHTATAPLLLVEDESALCLTCHGQTGAGATTDVMNGIQYMPGEAHRDSPNPNPSVILGALRAGGFANARIGTDSAGRLTYTGRSGQGTVGSPYTYPLRNVPFVPVRSTGQAVTSRHLNPLAPASAQAWGQGALNSGAGTSITLECTSCHNPHGNGQYRILNPIPGDHGGAFPEAATEKAVQDVVGGPTGTYNYTVIQKPGADIVSGTAPDGTPASYLRYASDVVTWRAGDSSRTETAGDYMHRNVPWFGRKDYTGNTSGVTYPAGGYNNDAPNARPSTFNAEITAWCAQCHTRYDTTAQVIPSGHGSYDTPSGDDIFMYRHGTARTACTTCHVAHGSNAQMTGVYSAVAPYPNGTADNSSRLLKIDNRGTCQACHDPTGTADAGDLYPTAIPTPVVP